jgi:hypothetical protein
MSVDGTEDCAAAVGMIAGKTNTQIRMLSVLVINQPSWNVAPLLPLSDFASWLGTAGAMLIFALSA